MFRRAGDHPRVRGEHNGGSSCTPCGWGSSPRARGAPHRRDPRRSAHGIIPACAGSTTSRPRTRCCSGDHPRVRGEHGRRGRAGPPVEGSSPRARGALVDRAGRRAGHGIIPACAGSTQQRSGATQKAWDHPRVRGEHLKAGMTGLAAEGSSPRARGALRWRRAWGVPLGIIPACAGSTIREGIVRLHHVDHPRVRGEHPAVDPAASLAWGSSPRARGARCATRAARGRPGIIPACAGSTPRCRSRIAGTRDHPRVRGEHAAARPKILGALGSSPRARGAQPPREKDRHRVGIIPACAGSTAAIRSSTVLPGDHPRVRGEHLPNGGNRRSEEGSSPRARGAHQCGGERDLAGGIIPACAGSTGRPGGTRHAGRGSSPRARGAPIGETPGDQPIGIIPACAGSTAGA